MRGLIYEAERQPQCFELPTSGTVMLGRGADCDLRLYDTSVSRAHCQIDITLTAVTLVDLGSRWGTTINGQLVSSQTLRHDDQIQVGKTKLRFVDETATETTLSPLASRRAEPRPLNLNHLVGETFVRYRVETILARSGTGIVYRATDLRTPRTVALKVYWPSLFSDDTTQARFLRAMRAMIPLEHPHLVKLHAAGKTHGHCFTSSEFVDGESTAQLLQRIGVAGMLDWNTVWRLAVGIAEALEYIHERHILHRSVLPNNILIRSDKTVKLGDSMLAKALDHIGQEAITRRGEMVGELHYLSPEQVSGSPQIDARADLYGLGATLYAILTGRPPFQGGPKEVVGKILSERPEPPTKTHLSVPSALESIVLRLLAKRPEDRYPNATQLLKDLRRVGRYTGIVEPS